MENISITTYRGFSKVKGRCSLNELIEKVRSSRYAALIEKIGRLISEGKTKEAENVKRQLDYFTVTANYHAGWRIVSPHTMTSSPSTWTICPKRSWTGYGP